MCSIPYSLLSKGDSNILPISIIQEHQNFCKLFSKAQTTYERKNDDNNNIIESNSPDKNKVNQNQLKIWSWFENLSLEQKIKICTIKNKWLVKIIIQLYFIYVIDNKSTFNPTNDMDILFSNQKNYQNIGGFLYKNIQIIPNYNNRKNYIGYNEDDYCKLYFNIKETDFSRIKKNTNEEQIQLEKKLLENIILLSIEDDSLDTISLSIDLLKDTKNLKKILSFFSDKKFLKDWLTPFNYSNYYNFTYPGWMHSNNKLTLCKILSGIFEQQILLLYEYFFYSKKIYEFPGIHSIIDIYKENNNLEKFLKDNYSYEGKKEGNNKENILTLDIVIDVVNKIKNDTKYKNKIDNFKKMLDQLYNDYYRSQFYNGNKILTEASENVFKELINEMGKEKGKEIRNLLNKITFMKLEDVKNYREYIYIFLRKYFIDLRNIKIINELLNEKQNKSGKKKKKKRKNKNKSIEPINNISNEDILQNKIEEKGIIEKNLNNDENNKTDKKQENIFEKINNRNDGSNSCSSNENDEEHEDENLKRGNKCKENENTLLTIKQINMTMPPINKALKKILCNLCKKKTLTNC